MFQQYHDIRNIGLGTKAPGITFPRRRWQVPRNWVDHITDQRLQWSISATWYQYYYWYISTSVKRVVFIRTHAEMWKVDLFCGNSARGSAGITTGTDSELWRWQKELGWSLHGEDDESARRRESVESSSPLLQCHLKSPPSVIWSEVSCDCVSVTQWPLDAAFRPSPLSNESLFKGFHHLERFQFLCGQFIVKKICSLHSKGNAGQQHLAPAQGPPWA